MSLGVIADSYVASGGGGGGGYSAAVLADSPLAYWRLGDASGTACVDSSGNGRDGTYAGSPTLGTTGLLTGDSDTAVTFDGTNDKVDITYGSWMDAGATITVEAIIKTNASGTRLIIDRDKGASSPRVFQFRLNNGVLEFYKIGGTGGVVGALSPLTYNDNVKHHVAATYDGTNIKLYVAGSLVKTQSAAGDLGAAAAYMSLGVNTSSGDNSWFSGVMDEAAYYGTALSGARIAAHAALM
jgi:hypothetical protein